MIKGIDKEDTMGQKCKICNHPERLEIDRQLIQGTARLGIARKYNFNPSSVDFHAKEHLSRQLLKSHEIKERIDSTKLLDEVETCLNKTKDILFQAELDKKATLQLQAIREIRSTIELLLKLGIDLARLQQERELAENGSIGAQIVFLPAKIDFNTAKEATDNYIEQMRQINKVPSALVVLPEENQLEEVSTPMTRTKTKSSSSERVRASVEMPDQDQESDAIDDILNWSPVVPEKGSTWGSKQPRERGY